MIIKLIRQWKFPLPALSARWFAPSTAGVGRDLGGPYTKIA
jgi:hypothetical protein